MKETLHNSKMLVIRNEPNYLEKFHLDIPELSPFAMIVDLDVEVNIFCEK